ncbi:MAG: amino acid permease [Aestuariivirga sp.]|nr:amino acid permease [Aestuariivirga sp.]
MKDAGQPAARPAALGFWGCTALVVGNMIGSGIFLLPASLAVYGPISILGWLATSLGAIALALVFARLAKRVPASGGPYAYTRVAYGDFTGFLIAWGYWIALWAGNAGVAVGFAGYTGYFFPGIAASPGFTAAVAITAIVLTTAINVRGVAQAGIVQIITTVLKVAPLVALVGLGMWSVDAANYAPFNASAGSALAAVAGSAALTLWAFLGLESATVPAGEVARPEITIPRATVLGTVFTAILYMAVTMVAMGLLSNSALRASTAPLADAVGKLAGPAAGSAIAIAAFVSTFGALNGFTLLTGQVPMSAARDRLFPPAFARLSPQGTPAFALILSNALAALLVLMTTSRGLVEAYTFITLLAVFAALVPYLFCSLAEVLLHAAGKSERPLGLAVPALGLVSFLYTMAAIYGVGAEVVLWGFMLLLLAVPIYAAQRSHEARGRASPLIGNPLMQTGDNHAAGRRSL